MEIPFTPIPLSSIHGDFFSIIKVFGLKSLVHVDDVICLGDDITQGDVVWAVP